MNTTMISLHAQHGPLIRTGPNEISVADLPAIKKIYGAGTKFRKSDWYSVWQGHRKFDLFAERNERIHGEQRRLVSRAYSMESLRDLEVYVDNAIKLFLRCMEERTGQVVDMGNWVQLFAFGLSSQYFDRRNCSSTDRSLQMSSAKSPSANALALWTLLVTAARSSKSKVH